MQEPFGGVFVLLSALFNVLVNDHNLGDTVCIPLIGLSVTFNPLRMPLSTLPSPGSRGCHFQPRCHTWGMGRVWNIFIANTEEGSTYICMFLFVLQCLADVSKVVMENGLSAMSSNIVLRKDLCEGMEGGLICICHHLHLLFYLLQQYQLFICDISYKVGRNSWQGEVTAEEGLEVFLKVRSDLPPLPQFQLLQ